MCGITKFEDDQSKEDERTGAHFGRVEDASIWRRRRKELEKVSADDQGKHVNMKLKDMGMSVWFHADEEYHHTRGHNDQQTGWVRQRKTTFDTFCSNNTWLPIWNKICLIPWFLPLNSSLQNIRQETVISLVRHQGVPCPCWATPWHVRQCLQFFNNSNDTSRIRRLCGDRGRSRYRLKYRNSLNFATSTHRTIPFS